MVLACAGHWYISLLFAAPVGVLLVGIKVMGRRDARHDAAELEAGAPAQQHPAL